MHRTHRMSRTAYPIVCLSLALGGLAHEAARAGDNRTPATGRGWGLLAQQTTTGQKEPVVAPTERGPTAVAKELIVPVGSTQRVQRADKKLITRVTNPKPNVAVVASDPGDPTAVLVTGKESGITRITLESGNLPPEAIEIAVQVDIEYLGSLLRRAAPTASLQLIPAANGTVVISGNVVRSDDIDVIMRSAVSVLGTADRVVNAMRVGGVMQVQLDVVVAYVARSELRRMSFDFLDIGQHHNIASTLGQGIVVPTVGNGINLTGNMLTIPNTIGAPNGAPANVFLAFFNNEQTFFGFLQALRNENLAKIMAQPKLVTLSGRTATLLSGGEQAVPEAAGLGTISVRFVPFGTRLTFLPIVLGNGKIHLEVEPEVTSLDQASGTSINGTVVAGRIAQSVHTTVEIEDGQTFAIGGLIQTNVNGTTVKLPILGDLPFLGAAFSSKSYQETESELVVIVTPHLVDPMSCDQLPKYLPGQETRTPDDFELYLEGILEAPRGPRQVFPARHYEPAYKNSPTAGLYPCAGGNCAGNGAACAAGCAVETAPVSASMDHKVGDGKPMPALLPEAVKPRGPAGTVTKDVGTTAPASSTATIPTGLIPSLPGSSPAKEGKPFSLPLASEPAGAQGGK